MQLRAITYASAEYEAAYALREAVLRRPLGLTLTHEDRAEDAGRLHLGAFVGDALCGCASLILRGEGITQLKQMAVDPAQQGSGIGRAIVVAMEKLAGQHGAQRMVLNARSTAIGFYETLGYHAVGEEFAEQGIPHIRMEKTLV